MKCPTFSVKDEDSGEDGSAEEEEGEEEEPDEGNWCYLDIRISYYQFGSGCESK